MTTTVLIEKIKKKQINYIILKITKLNVKNEGDGKKSNPVSLVCTLFGAKKHTTKKNQRQKKPQFVRQIQ